MHFWSFYVLFCRYLFEFLVLLCSLMSPFAPFWAKGDNKRRETPNNLQVIQISRKISNHNPSYNTCFTLIHVIFCLFCDICRQIRDHPDSPLSKLQQYPRNLATKRHSLLRNTESKFREDHLNPCVPTEKSRMVNLTNVYSPP